VIEEGGGGIEGSREGGEFGKNKKRAERNEVSV
jgi:hypothetical protein